MRKTASILLFLTLCIELAGQAGRENLSGQVSYVSSQNIYVKFRSTAGISVGDTLYTQKSGKPVAVLVVRNLSSTSCVCESVGNNNFSIADVVIANVVPVKNKEAADSAGVLPASILIAPNQPDSVSQVTKTDGYNQRIRGSISINSYSDFSNTIADNSQRYRYTFSLDASNIANTRLSLESYMSFKYKAGEWQEVKDNVFNALKIYNLALRYDLNKTTRISIGRRINQKISSIGAMDGVQLEKKAGRFAFGVLVGSRPDYQDYSIDFSLFQYGAYTAFSTKSDSRYTESSLAFMQQTNSGKTDRRFLYFQHSNTLVKNLNFFGTVEADLYELMTDSLNNETVNNNVSLTGLYVSLNYRPLSKLSLSGSYDARKNVIYYETYKTYVDRILEDELRQGFRLQGSYRITRDMTFGLHAGYRYLKSDPHPTRNIYSYFTYNQIPSVNLSATLSATLLESSFMNGQIYSINLSRDFLNGKIQTGIGYRYVDYRLPENSIDILQNMAEMNFSWQIFEKTSFSMSYEGTFEKNDKYNRIYLQLRKRF